MQRLNQQPQRVQITPLWSIYVQHGRDMERTRNGLGGSLTGARVVLEVGLVGVGIRTRIISTFFC